MTQDEIKALETELESLNQQEEDLTSELDDIMKSKNLRKLKKAELQREVTIRRELDRISDRKEEIERKLAEDKQHGRKKGFLRTVAILAVLGIVGFIAYKSYNKNGTLSCAPVNADRSISTTNTPSVTTKNVVVGTAGNVVEIAPTVEPTAVPTATPFVFDVTDDEQVAEAANRVYENSVMAVTAENPSLARFASQEVIEDFIKMLGGELPKNSEYNDYTIGEKMNIINEVFANQGNGNTLYPVRYSSLFPEGSLESEYLKTYEVIWDQIDAYRREGNGDGVVEQVGHLGTKIWNEWALAGLYGDWNPYLFPAEEHYFLLQMCVAPYANHVDEWSQANDLVVCFDSCRKIDENGQVMFDENGEPLYEQTAVKDLIEALYMGTSTNGKFAIYRDNKVINVFAETYADAKNYFDAKADVKVKGLN